MRLGSTSIEPLIRTLQSRDAWRNARERAAEALGRLSSPRAIEALTAASHDDHAEVRRAAADALRAAAGRREAEGRAGQEETPGASVGSGLAHPIHHAGD